jgi:hypothetical protein
MKICIKCNVQKRCEEFYKSKINKSGFLNSCKKCHDVSVAKWKMMNKDKVKNIKAAWRENNREKAINLAKNWQKNNVERVKNNVKLYQKQNRAKFNSLQSKRRAMQTNATPKWLTFEQLNQIEEFYRLAQELRWLSEENLEVDHIIPLQSKNVCGLHVPWNLQILPASLNRTKSNRV